MDDHPWLALVAAAAAARLGLGPDPQTDVQAAVAGLAASGSALGAVATPSSAEVAAQAGPLAHLGAAVAADPGLLGDLWAAAADGAANKALGRFFTPPAVVEALLPARLPGAGPVLDPACGGGRFLLAALTRHPAGAAGLWGIDRDPLAVAICRVALWLASGGDARARIERGDPLLGLLLRREGAQGAVSGAVGEALGDALGEAVDVAPGAAAAVVGNPPFRSGRRGGGLAEPARWRRHFVAADDQLDPYPLFVELGLHALAPGGCLRFVMPDAGLVNLRARGLRRLMVAENRLAAVVRLPAGTFAAGVDAVVVTVEKGGRTAPAVAVTDLQGRPDGQLRRDPADPLAPLTWAGDAAAEALWTARSGWHLTLGAVAEVTRGVNPYHHTRHTPAEIAARVHHADHRAGPDFVPELRGRDVPDAYAHHPAGAHWIRYGPGLKEPRHPRYFEGPRLLVRKVLGATACGVGIEAPLVCDQSLYVVKPRPDCRWPLFALLACVNSRVARALLGGGFNDATAVFPQLKVADLRGLPLPPVDPEDPRVQAVAAQAEALQAAWCAGLAAGDLAPRTPTPALAAARAALEAAVAALYGVAPPHEPILRRHSPAEEFNP